jgi:CRP/FNR family transcriptional regulator
VRIRQPPAGKRLVSDCLKPVADAPSPQAICALCSLGKLCFPSALPTGARGMLPVVQEKRTRIARGEGLFSAGQRQLGVYAVKAGFLKTTVCLHGGHSKIVGFHPMGDILGLDGMGNGVHTLDAVALSDCEVCVIPMAKFEKLLEFPIEAAHVRQLLSRELSRIGLQAGALGVLSARQLVAMFLLDMSGSWHHRGYSKSEFLLFMTRKEIANYLGLTFETVSRVLSHFQSMQWISLDGKHLLIRDMAALRTQQAVDDRKAPPSAGRSG